jgi:type VI secretion system secreted protein VgrG
MPTYTQETRRFAIETPLGKDVLLLHAFTGKEEMSRLFSYSVDLLSSRDDIAPKEIVGKNVTLAIQYADTSWRHINGHVSRFAWTGMGDRLNTYHAEVVPWLWFLTRTSDCRIFQQRTVPDIIEQIIKDLGFTNFTTDEIRGTHDPWDYCVQYRETDFNFVSRLMEHEGIFYFFKHEKGKHTLVLADQKVAYKEGRETQLEMHRQSGPELFDQVYSWEHAHEFRSGKWTQTDYNFETPSTSLLTHTNSVINLDGNTKLEFYDYPGAYEQKSEGNAETRLRMEEEEAPHDTVFGESTCRGFSPGVKFKIKKHPHKSEEGKSFVITSVSHTALAGSTYVGNGDGSSGNLYRNTFTCIPDAVTFRPARITRKPVVHGAQTAVVVGPKGEEIYTDKYGRIKVQFHWDREGKKDEKSSCWIRCAQISAGKNWGVMSIPRIGQEVVVTYLEGDPDRPLVTGVVYNAEQMPAYTLPDEKTKSWIKTNTSKGGDGFNEIRFEDKKDKEQVFIHAQRNMDTRVKNDCMERIGGNRHLIVGNENGGDQRELVHNDKHLTVKGNQIELIEVDNRLTVGGDQDIVVRGTRAQLVKGDDHVHVEGARFDKVDGDHWMDVAMHRVKSRSDQFFDADQVIAFKAGAHVIFEAGTELSLVAPGGFIHIGAGGVTIDGIMVWINSGGPGPGRFSGIGPTSGRPDAREAAPIQPTEADNSKTGYKSCPD